MELTLAPSPLPPSHAHELLEGWLVFDCCAKPIVELENPAYDDEALEEAYCNCLWVTVEQARENRTDSLQLNKRRLSISAQKPVNLKKRRLAISAQKPVNFKKNVGE